MCIRDSRYTECGFKLTEDELNLMAKLKAHALVGIISDWVRDGMHDNYMNYFEQIHDILEFENAGYSLMSNERMLPPQRPDSENLSIEKKCTKAC